MIFTHFMQLFFTILYINYVKSNILYDFIIKFEKIKPCEDYCEESQEIAQCKSCCNQGCRFFSLIYMVEHGYSNSTKDSCDSSCLEAYPDGKLRSFCHLGCSFMADQHTDPRLPLFLDDHITQDLVIFQPPQEVDPDYVLTDPALRRQFLLPADNALTIPQSRINTLPYQRLAVEEADLKSGGVGVGGGGWLDCVARRSGMPRLALTSVFLLVVLLSLFLCLAPGDARAAPPPPYTPLPMTNSKA